ncbi:MAG: hypothetical protein Q9164_002716 [Protoblastenia rupestris]
MAPESTALTTKVASGSPYQLDSLQTLKASSALLKHIVSSTQNQQITSEKKDLLTGDASISEDAQPIWLVLTTKKHIVPQPRLKPGKIFLPHSLNTSPTLSICLITPDPQRAFKDLVAHPSFPSELSKSIARVIDIKKLEKKYHSFESKRQLRDSYDIFFADDRIVTYLAKILGKTFYSTTPKRPIPVHLEGYKPKTEKKNAALPSTKPKKDSSDPKSIATPQAAAKEIERTLSMTQVNLSPSVTTSVRVGRSSQTPEQLAKNIEAVVAGMIDKYIPRQWRGVKAIHIKGPNTMALPIWLADELWDDEAMVIEDHEAEEAKAKALQKGKRKRKALEGDGLSALEGEKENGKRKIDDEEPKQEVKKKRRKIEDEDLSQEMEERRQKLKQQKRELKASMKETSMRSKVETKVVEAAS